MSAKSKVSAKLLVRNAMTQKIRVVFDGSLLDR